MPSVDPACGMAGAEEDAPRTTFDGAEDRFWREMCRHAFMSDPERFLSSPVRPHPVAEGSRGHRDLPWRKGRRTRGRGGMR